MTMKSTAYSEKVLDHFRNPRNVGELEGEQVSLGRVGNPVCGDLMDIYIDVEEDDEGVERIKDIKFKTFGCGSAVATSSMITELARGKTLDEALAITRKDVATELDGLPPIKMHCSNLAADALHEAIKNYRACKSDVTDGESSEEPTDGSGLPKIAKEDEYLGKGLYHTVEDSQVFKNKRVLVYGSNDSAVTTALSLTDLTGRVVLVNPLKNLAINDENKIDLQRSDVKVLSESDLIGVDGFGEVEKVRIHDKDEDEEYELFVDAVVVLT